jgi:cyclic pyranopterin phosphate synthase
MGKLRRSGAAAALRDLRISVTDRCNFRCAYCMPKEHFGPRPGFKFLPHAALLSFEEITRLAGVFVRLGVRKLRLTGGEPLLRRELPRLIASWPRCAAPRERRST